MDKKLIEQYKRELIRNYHGAVPVDAYVNGVINNGNMTPTNPSSGNVPSNNQMRQMNNQGAMNNQNGMNNSSTVYNQQSRPIQNQNTMNNPGSTYNQQMRPTPNQSTTNNSSTTANQPTRPTPNQDSSVNPGSAPGNHKGEIVVTVTSVNGLYPVPNALVTVFTGDYRTNMQTIATETTDNNGLTRPIPLETVSKANSQTSGSSLPPFISYNILIQSDDYLDNIHLNIPIFEDITSIQRSDLILTATAGANKNPQIFDESKSFNL